MKVSLSECCLDAVRVGICGGGLHGLVRSAGGGAEDVVWYFYARSGGRVKWISLVLIQCGNFECGNARGEMKGDNGMFTGGGCVGGIDSVVSGEAGSCGGLVPREDAVAGYKVVDECGVVAAMIGALGGGNDGGVEGIGP